MIIMGYKKVLYEGTYYETELPQEVVDFLGIESGDQYRYVSLDGNVFVEKTWIDYGDDNNEDNT